MYMENGITYLTVEKTLLLDVGIFIMTCEKNLDSRRKNKRKVDVLDCGSLSA